MRPQVHSQKHYVQWTLSSLGTAGTKTEESVALALTHNQSAAVFDVDEGCTIKAVYFELWITSDDTSQGSFSINVEKTPGNLITMSYAQSIALNGYTNKKNVFYTTQGLMGPFDEAPMNPLRFWIKIPKSKQRFGLNDHLRINISTISNGLIYCGFATYKEYT